MYYIKGVWSNGKITASTRGCKKDKEDQQDLKSWSKYSTLSWRNCGPLLDNTCMIQFQILSSSNILKHIPIPPMCCTYTIHFPAYISTGCHGNSWIWWWGQDMFTSNCGWYPPFWKHWGEAATKRGMGYNSDHNWYVYSFNAFQPNGKHYTQHYNTFVCNNCTIMTI